MMRLPFGDFKRVIDRELAKGKDVVVAYDSDADGCSAAALLILYVMEKTGNYPVDVISCFHDVDTKIKDKEGTVFVLDTMPRSVDKENVVVIDHHFVRRKPKNMKVFNPRLYDPSLYMSTSCLVYNILNMPKEAAWIAAIGIKADKSEETCEKIVKTAYRVTPEFKKLERKLVSLVSASKNMSDARIVVNSLIESYKMGGPSFFGKTPSSSKLKVIINRVRENLMKALLKMERVMETRSLLINMINSGYNLQGLIASKLLRLTPEKTIIVCNTGLSDDLVYGEVRTNSDKEHKRLFAILEEICEDIGGHEKAFGFSIKKENFKVFLEKIS